MILFPIIVATLFIDRVYCQLVSPCPETFMYEPNDDDDDRWYGQITLLSNSDLLPITLKVKLDRQSLQMGNWFGEIETTDHKEYLIKSNKNLKANSPMIVKFYIKYSTTNPPPKVVEIKLNSRTICLDNYINSTEQTTHNVKQSQIFAHTDFRRPSLQETDDDDDFFPGDFAIISKQHDNVLQLSCGTVIKQPTPLITFGQPSEETEFPWHAAVYISEGVKLTYSCAGSLISKYHIITLAQCVVSVVTYTILPTSSLLIYLGKYHLSSWESPRIQDKIIESIVVHPEFSFENVSNDIAIIKLQTPAIITDYVRPVCLWQGPTTLEPIIGKEGIIAGWGFDENERITDDLRKAHMPIVSQRMCINSQPNFFSKYTSDKTFCAGYRNGTSACLGDAGGGLVLPIPNSNANNPTWQLRGIASVGVSIKASLCDTSHYVVFTDIAKHLDWIRSVLKT